MKRLWSGLLGAFAAGMMVAYGISRAHAYGIPAPSTLAYSGRLLTYGQPDNNIHQMSIALYLSGSTTAACGSATPANIATVNGQFTVPIPATCVPVIHANPNMNVQVTIDGVPMGVTALTAVPYAVEADTASNVAPGSALAVATVPSGMISFFNATTCPTGWSVVTAAGGRHLVGLSANGTLGGTAGTPLADQEARMLPVHSHGVTDPGHAHFIDSAPTDDHNFSGTGNNTQQYGVVADAGAYNGGNPSGINYGVNSVGAVTGVTVNTVGDYTAANLAAPYIQFLVCQKN